MKTPTLSLLHLLLLLSLLLAACQPAVASLPASNTPLAHLNTPEKPTPLASDPPLIVTPQTTASLNNAVASRNAITPPSAETDSPLPATLTPVPQVSPSPFAPSPTPLPAEAWMMAPITPTVSETARRIYAQGQALGRNPHAFSKVGDCQSITTYFLAHFDTPNLYRLGPYSALQATIDWFPGSFARQSLAVKGGLNAAAMLSPFRADPKQCQPGEPPLACEYRLNNPSIAIISLEEWWEGAPEKYELYMRQIIEYTLQQGIVPILGAKADNLEGDHTINATLYRLSLEYDIPFWNFWAAVQPLPSHGLLEDGFHLTHGNNFYFDEHIPSGWTMRNLTALIALDAVRQALNP